MYQEAALIYAAREKKPIPVAVSPEVRQRIEHFAGIYQEVWREQGRRVQ